MSPPAVARLVARLFAASGRDFGRSHLEVYAEALADVDDEIGEAAGRRLVRHVDWERPPSVRLVLDEVQAGLRRRDAERPAIAEATGEPLAPAESQAALALVRERHSARLADSLPAAESGQARPAHLLAAAAGAAVMSAVCLAVLWACLLVGSALAVR